MGKCTGKPYIWWQKLWFPVDFPLTQSIDIMSTNNLVCEIIDLSPQGLPKKRRAQERTEESIEQPEQEQPHAASYIWFRVVLNS